MRSSEYIRPCLDCRTLLLDRAASWVGWYFERALHGAGVPIAVPSTLDPTGHSRGLLWEDDLTVSSVA